VIGIHQFISNQTMNQRKEIVILKHFHHNHYCSIGNQTLNGFNGTPSHIMLFTQVEAIELEIKGASGSQWTSI
jgi:hypothetical protein